ncbi:hypothetical protein [Novosphingobium sp. BL-52-GroH]|uniref:hypothetical protein n=1 Tax=Novosphingobium sp. BL-52-GroH TaxID=3349877 RepID=UPI00384F2301
MLAGFALVSACNALPRDPADTSGRIARDHSFKIGFADANAAVDPQSASLVKKLEAATHAKAIIVDAAGEVLLKHLADGEVDVALGDFPANTPWQTEIAFAPPLRTRGKSDALELKAAMRNGENRWIMTVERASRAVAGPGADE